MIRNLVIVGVIGVSSAGLSAASYNLVNFPNTTVSYEAKESLTNSDSPNSIVRSLGLAGDPTFGLLSDATINFSGGGGPGFKSPDTNPHGIADANNIITQHGANKSTLDLTFNAAAGQVFSAGDLRFNSTVFPSVNSLWDIGVDYLGWQVSTCSMLHAEKDTDRRCWLSMRDQLPAWTSTTPQSPRRV